MSDTEVNPRVRLLAVAALDGAGSAPPALAWQQWRELLPDLDDISGGEMRLLPAAWDCARRDGAQDRDSGRLRGVQRLTHARNATALRAAGHHQQHLAAVGIPSALSGAAAAALLAYPNTGLRPIGGFELVIPPGEARSVGREPLGRGAGLRSLVTGRRPSGPGEPHRLVWWRPDLTATSSAALNRCITVPWQETAFEILSPHDTAYGLLLQHFLVGGGHDPSWVVDFNGLSRHPQFDPVTFVGLVRGGGWRGLFAQRGREAGDLLPDHLAVLLGVQRAAVWGPIQSGAARSTVSLYRRTARRWRRASAARQQIDLRDGAAPRVTAAPRVPRRDRR